MHLYEAHLPVADTSAAQLVDVVSSVSTPSNRGSTVKSISLRRCVTYPLMVFPSSADGSIIWMGKQSRRSCTDETSTRSICSSRRHRRVEAPPPTLMTRRGYNVLAWRNDGMKYWAVSDLNQAELRQFTGLFER